MSSAPTRLKATTSSRNSGPALTLSSASNASRSGREVALGREGGKTRRQMADDARRTKARPKKRKLWRVAMATLGFQGSIALSHGQI